MCETAEELVAAIKRLGGIVEPVDRHCRFQTFGQSFLDYCVQPPDLPYRVNLGSAGGPAVVCNGLPRQLGDEVAPCPSKVEGRTLGWRVMLPAPDV